MSYTKWNDSASSILTHAAEYSELGELIVVLSGFLFKDTSAKQHCLYKTECQELAVFITPILFYFPLSCFLLCDQCVLITFTVPERNTEVRDYDVNKNIGHAFNIVYFMYVPVKAKQNTHNLLFTHNTKSQKAHTHVTLAVLHMKSAYSILRCKNRLFLLSVEQSARKYTAAS